MAILYAFIFTIIHKAIMYKASAYRWFFITTLFVLTTTWVDAQEPSYKQITTRDGLPSNTIYSMCQDKEGYMWIGTGNGLTRYDGSTFKKYKHPKFRDQDILVINNFYDRVWLFNMAGQVFFVENDSLHLFNPANLLTNKTVIQLVIDKQGRVWLGGRKFVMVFSINAAGQYILEKGHLISPGFNDPHFLIDEQEEVYVFIVKHNATPGKMYKLDVFSDSYHRILPNKELSGFEQFRAFQFDKGKAMLISTTSNTIYLWENNKMNTLSLTIPDVNKKKIYHTVYRDKDLNYWVTSNNGGVWGFTPSKEPINPHRPYFPNERLISKIYQDNEGNHWFGTLGGGIYLVPNIHSQFYSPQNSDIPVRQAFSIEEGKNGDIIIGMAKGRTWVIQKSGEHFNLPVEKGSEINDLCYVEETDILYCSSNTGAYELVNYSGNPPIITDRERVVSSSKELRRGYNNEIWMGHREGVVSWDKKIKFDFENRCYAIYQESPTKIWMGILNKGLFIYEKDSLWQHPFPITTLIKDINKTKDGTMWLATNGKGIIGFQDTSILYQPAPDITSTEEIIVDEAENLWVATNLGVLKVLAPNYNTWELVDMHDGLVDNQVSSIYKQGDTLWAATYQGLNFMNIQRNFTDSNHLTVVIEALKGMDSTYSLTGKQEEVFELPYWENQINISYSAIAFIGHENVSYSYSLEGYEKEWFTTSSKTVNYQLSPGNYVFRIRGINPDGLVSNKEQRVRFRIKAAIWQTAWFKGLLLLLAGALMYALFQYRLRTIKQQEVAKTALNKRLADLKMQALYAQMNPHFVFNCLNALQSMIHTNQQTKASKYISSFSKLVRSIFENSKQSLLPLEDEIEFLHLYIDLELLRFGEKVSVDVDVGNTLEEDVFIPPLIIQPILENAFRHGLLHKKEGGKLKVSFELKKEVLVCIVEDNGVGRKKAKEMGSWRPTEYQSSGLDITQQRIDLLQTNTQVENVKMEIIDLEDDDGVCQGTKVKILIPVLRE